MAEHKTRPRGRPPISEAKSRAEIQRDYRARRKAAGKVLRVIDASAMTGEIAELHEKLHDALLKLELRKQDVARLTARADHLEVELKRLEQHHTNALKEVAVLKHAAGPEPQPSPGLVTRLNEQAVATASEDTAGERASAAGRS